LICALLAAWFAFAGLAQAQTPDVDYVPGEVIVILKPGGIARLAGKGAALRTPGVQRVRAARYGRMLRLKVTPGREAAVIAELRASGAVEVASLNHIVTAQVVPDDPGYDLQWAPPKIDAPAAWDVTTGSPTVTIAVVDSGLDMAHPEFSGRVVDPWDVIDDDGEPEDANGHGTHVTGILGATGNNATGIAGMAWDVSLMPVRVLDATGYGNDLGVAQGIYHAVAHGAQIINLSLGGPAAASCEAGYPAMSQAVKDAHAAGRLVVAAAGNDGAAQLRCPGRLAEALAVGATTASDARLTSSNYGQDLDLTAPGQSIYSTLPGEDYGNRSGTSMATAHVSGLAALVWSLVPALTRDEVRAVLESTADDLGTPGWDMYFGFGRINAGRALASLGPDLVVNGRAVPNPVFAGQPLTYTLSLTNTGRLTATGIALTQTIPEGLALASVSPGCQAGAGVVTCSLASLAPAGEAEFETGATVLESTYGILTSQVTISAEPPDQPAGNVATITVTVVTHAVTETLWLGQTTVPDDPRSGQPLTYTLTAANLSCAEGAEAANAVLTDSLPAAVQFGRAVAGSGVACTHSGALSGGLVVCQLGTLGTCTQPTSTAVIGLVVTPTLTGPVTNTACLGSQRAGPDAVCVVATAEVGASDVTTETLHLSQAIAPEKPRLGHPLTYTLTAANLSCAEGAEAANVVLTDRLPAVVQFNRAVAGPGVGCTHSGALSGGMVVCQLGTLGTCTQPTSTAVVHLVVTPTALGPITNTACLGSQRAGPDAVCVGERAVVRTFYYLPLIYRDPDSGDVITQP
jgi:thermitase